MRLPLHHVLTGIESMVMTDAMNTLRAEGILSLPMYDGLIVPLSAVEAAEAALTAAGRAVAKVELALTVDRAESR